MAKRNRKKKKGSGLRIFAFVLEIIVLVLLVGTLFAFGKIQSGIRSIGSGAGTAAQSGTIRRPTAQTTGQPSGQTTGQASAAGQTLAGAANPSAASTAEEPVGPDPNAADFFATLLHDNDGDAAEENEEVSRNEHLRGYTNIALVGIDTRDSGQIDYANSDTMLIASINNTTGQVRMVSLYRDTLLNIGTREQSASQGDLDEENVTFEDDFGGEDGGYDDAGGDAGGDDGSYDDAGGDAGGDDGGSDDAGGDAGGDDGSYDDAGGDAGEGSYTDDGSGDNSSSSGSGESGGSGSGSGSSSSGGSYDSGSSYSGSGSSGSSDSGSYGSSGGSSYDGGQSGSLGGNDQESEEEDNPYANNAEYNALTLSEESNDFSGVTTSEGRYDKANAAYANGSARQLLTMLNRNLDLNIHDYVVVDFSAVAKLVEDVDGIDVEMTYEEVVHMNNYCIETSELTGLSYTPIEPEELPREYHLNGVQAVSYARIRFTTGNDMKRTQRQRVVIQKVIDKAKSKGLQFIQGMIRDVFPMCKTSLSSAAIIKLATAMISFEVEKTTGFPFEHLEKDVYVGSKKLDAVVPVTLELNVRELHEFLFDDPDYQVSETVKGYSRDIESLSNLTEKSREAAKQNSVIGLAGGEADEVN